MPDLFFLMFLYAPHPTRLRNLAQYKTMERYVVGEQLPFQLADNADNILLTNAK